MLGLPTEWSKWLLSIVLVLLPITFVVPFIVSFLRKQESRKTNGFRVKYGMTMLSLWRRCLCVLLAYLMLLNPQWVQSLSEGAVQFSDLDARHWTEGNRMIEYGYDSNGSLTSKVTKVTSPEEIIETVTYDYNLQNRLAHVTTSHTEGSDNINDITEYTYNDEGIRVRSYHYQIVNGGARQDEETKVFLIDAYNHTGYAQVLEEWTPENCDKRRIVF